MVTQLEGSKKVDPSGSQPSKQFVCRKQAGNNMHVVPDHAHVQFGTTAMRKILDTCCTSVFRCDKPQIPTVACKNPRGFVHIPVILSVVHQQ